MGKRKPGAREESKRPSARPAPFNNPFGGLADLRGQLPAGSESPRTPPPPPEVSLQTCGKLVIQLEKKGRSGKTVTRVKGLPGSLIDELTPRIKAALGCGATVEEGDLVLLGGLSDRVERWLREEGAGQVVVSGRGPGKRQGRPGSARSVESAPTSAQGLERGRDGRRRADLEVGLTVDVVLKRDQETGTLTRGVVQQLLTRSQTHPHGIKVRLEDGQVGRVKHIP